METNAPDSPEPSEGSEPRWPEPDEELEEAVIAADDTGLISSERLITIAEIEEAESEQPGEGNV